MVDYQTWASIAIIFQALFTLALIILTYQYKKATERYANATDKYVATTEKILGETAKYTETTEEILNASLIDRQISYIEKKLEKLYMPIYNNQKLINYLPLGVGESTLPASETMGINKFVAEIKPYSYLADDPLRTKLEKLLIESGTLLTAEAKAKKQGQEYIKLKEDILREITKTIEYDKLQLEKMIKEHRIKFTKTGKIDVT